MIEDAELLRRHVEDRSEDAFRELVGRHLNFVYSAALRQVNGDIHLAKDVSQVVFTDLARKADSLTGRRVLAGWLFVSTRYAAAKLVRRERRRQAREQEAYIMSEQLETNEHGCDWSRVGPVLDHALSDLSEADREAILLRFFEGRAFAEVGAQLRLTENTARMRVERALDKLRLLLLRQGVSSTTGALAAALASQGVVAAPTGLGALVSGTALASAGTGGAVGLVMSFMSMSKLQLGILGAVAATGTTAFVVQTQTQTALAGEIAAVQRENRAMNAALPALPRAARTQPVGDGARDYDAGLAQLAAETAALQTQASVNARVALSPTLKATTSSFSAELDRFPRPKARVAPAYPKELRDAGVTGEVLVEFVVDTTGAVQAAHPVSSTHPGFEAAAVAAVEQWKFGAGLKGGRPVNTRLQQTITFALSVDASEGAAIRPSPAAPGEDQQQPASTWF